jgi:hypothetical protein
MELIEKIPLQRLQFLSTVSFSDFKTAGLCKTDAKNDDDRKQNYNYVMSYVKGLIKAKGEMKRAYTYTDSTPLEVGGRLYCGLSIQGVSSKIRGFLLHGETTDIDMKNAHPVILRYICKLHNFPCPNLEYYINNRDEILSRFDENGKTEFLKAVNSDKTNKKIKDKFYKEFDKECKNIQKHITSLKDYKHIVETVPSTKVYNWLGSAINRILCVYENKILQELINELIRRQIEICALMFDGLMVYGDYYHDYYDDNVFLTSLEKVINEKFDGLNMKLTYKEHKQGFIEMSDDFELEDVKEVPVLTKSFSDMCKSFEKEHAKITNKGYFVKQLENDNILMSRQHLKTAYEHLTYEEVDKDGKVKNHNFINDWLVNNPTIRRYDDLGIYPKDEMCPPNMFNMWRKFAMEMITDYEPNEDALQTILNHIKILCNHEEPVYDYFVKWIAQMIQYPETKSICMVLISKEGAGKGTLIRLFEKMFGMDKVFETHDPSRDVWGDFNGRMANTFFVNLDELSKKDTMESEGKIKGLITEPRLTINNKGINKYDIDSYHRFLVSTNNEEPMNSSKDDRRKEIIRSSDELIGNKEYFNKLYEYLDDVNVVKTCFEYFKSIPNMDKFNKIPLPTTHYHNELKELSKSPIEKWIEDFTLQNMEEEKETVELSKEEIHAFFSSWCSSNKVEYKVDSLKLLVRINRLNINGILKHKTKTCNKTQFVISDLKTHFGLGCLL